MALAIPKNIRLQIRADIVAAKFPIEVRERVESILVRSVREFRLQRKRLGKTVMLPEDLSRRRGRGRPSEEMLRAVLISALFQAWMIGFDEYPKINNKNHRLTPFVRFATTILMREGIGKTEDHLEEFRSYRKKCMLDSGFQVVRGVVI